MSSTTPLICPECKAGKHGNCDGTTLDLESDCVEACRCAIDWHGKPVVATTAVALPAMDVPVPNPAREAQPSIEGMVDDLGRPATIFTPPELLRRDPNRWPTPAEFVSEWEQFTPECRVQMAERILADAQAVEPLRRERDEARAEVLTWTRIAEERRVRWGEAAEMSSKYIDKVARVEEIADSHGQPGAWVRSDENGDEDTPLLWVTHTRAALDGFRIVWSSRDRRYVRAALADPEPAQVQQADEACAEPTCGDPAPLAGHVCHRDTDHDGLHEVITGNRNLIAWDDLAPKVSLITRTDRTKPTETKD